MMPYVVTLMLNDAKKNFKKKIKKFKKSFIHQTTDTFKRNKKTRQESRRTEPVCSNQTDASRGVVSQNTPNSTKDENLRSFPTKQNSTMSYARSNQIKILP